MPEPRIIKRYANRKLYDTQHSHYVTLEQIAEMIRSGEEVRVLDNSSKDDLTSVTLAQIIFEEEKKQKSFLPLGDLRRIIQSGGASLSELAQHAQARVRSVFHRDQPASEEHPAAAPEPEAAAPETGKKEGPVREFLERSQQTFEEWQKRVDDRLRNLLDALSPFAALEKEVAALRERIEALEKEAKEARQKRP